MKKVRGLKYTVNGFEDATKFASGILALTNAKSSRKGTVVDIQTHEGLNLVTVISLIPITNELTELMGKITEMESIDIINVEFGDLNTKGQQLVTDTEDETGNCLLVMEME